MDYTYKNIYELFGQFDKVVTICFKDNTESFNKFGESLTGIFFYTNIERKKLENKNNDTDSIQKIKFKELLKDVDEELRNDLRYEGFIVSDIYSIFTLNIKSENEYKKTSTRKLPKQNIIKVDIDKETDFDNITLNMKMN